MNLLGSNVHQNFLMEELDERNDSVLISYDDLRIVNSKLIELKYEKEINTNLKSIISNDSIIINKYKDVTNKLNNDCKKSIRQRNIFIGSTVVALIVSMFLLLK